MNLIYLCAALAIILPGVGVSIGQANLVRTSITLMGKNPSLSNFFLVVTILGLAIIESIAIYGLLIALNILGQTGLDPSKALSAALTIGITGFGVGFLEGPVVSVALEAMNRNPATKGSVLAFMILFLALIEVVAIYGLIIANKILA
ncbi:ATP synthase F0 subunit C [Candidatus Gracilibacteria bacterium]|nr:ATP synthase F0 subunit C [Candidatus Gracilibacteria bacterium]NUJ98841.1 ATP synthase F0 subunit C [Candidatus Gracilibacteria bacterium]